jgi:hypothetical protein
MTSQYGAYALHAGKVRLHARTFMHTPTRPGTHTHARTYSRTHRPISNICCFSMATMIYERASVLHYTYTACFVYHVLKRVLEDVTIILQSGTHCNQLIRILEDFFHAFHVITNILFVSLLNKTV